MNANLSKRQRTNSRELSQVIEPLASYVSAADRPREALLSVITALFDEVQGTHRATLMHLACQQIESLGLAS